MEVEPLKTCRKCGIDKELDQFYENYRHPGGYNPRCKKCYREARKDYLKSESYRKSIRKHALKKRYGLTPEQFESMVKQQNGKCANPGCESAGTHVDHDHDTGRVRALLCSGCNLAFGNLYENERKILGLAEYAKRFA